ncbi:MAG: hypothetical protein AB8B54_01365 [Sphingorhabdus sp.]
MRNLVEIGCTLSGQSSRDIAPDQEGHLSNKISHVLTLTMPHLRDGVVESTAASDLKALFIGLTQKPRHATVYFVDGVNWTVKSLQSSDQAIDAIGIEEFEYVFISIHDVDEFAPSIATRIRSMKNTVTPKIIAYDNHVPKYLSEHLIRSGVDKIVISNRL